MTELTPIFKSRRGKLSVLVLTAAMRIKPLILTRAMRADLPLMLARRGQRVNNRRPDVAAAYETKHAILAKGKR